MLYGLAAAIVSTILAVFSRLQVERQRGRRNAAKSLPDGPIIVISNHTSYADGLLLALACRRLGRSLRLLATAGVFKAPLIGSLTRKLGFIPVNRGAADASTALDAAAEALAAGEAIGLYPEGRITRDPAKWPERSKTGAVRLALRTGAPIVPLAMEGAHRVVGSSGVVGGLLRSLVRRPKVTTRIGDPIDVAAMLGSDEPTPERIRLLADDVMSRLIDLIEDLRGEPAPHSTGAPQAAD